jgi:hypothetical protein
VIPRGQSEGLEMVMPEDLTVRKVADLVGHDTRVEVIGNHSFSLSFMLGGRVGLGWVWGSC